MLLICLRDDIPLSLNDRQFSQFQGHIRETLYNLTGKYHDVYEHLNNLDVHQIHNIFFCDINDPALERFAFIPDVVCNLYEPAKYVAPASDLVVSDNNTANADLHSVMFDGNRISFYIDSKIRFNSKFDFQEMLLQLLPYIQLHLAGHDISDIYCKKNMMITQVSSVSTSEFSRSVLSYIRKMNTDDFLSEYNLDNQSVIERLLQDNWYIFFDSTQEMKLLLQVCHNAGIKWSSGEALTKGMPDEALPSVVYDKGSNALFYYTKRDLPMISDPEFLSGVEDLTDWFFHAIKK